MKTTTVNIWSNTHCKICKEIRDCIRATCSLWHYGHYLNLEFFVCLACLADPNNYVKEEVVR